MALPKGRKALSREYQAGTIGAGRQQETQTRVAASLYGRTQG